MLPPQLRCSLLPARHVALSTLALKASTSSVLRARSFWSWRRDWASHLDPVYHRFSRSRTLKTRAKLLKSLRRRGKFDWDYDTKPFFTPRLVRWASHWDGSGKRKGWYLDGEDGKKNNDPNQNDELQTAEDGFELSAREKEWRERMEAMRKRIEKDPYEAIFGKRFEPFWSPLVPSWMREEMGLQGWPKASKNHSKESSNTTPEQAVTRTVKNDTAEKAKTVKPETPKKDVSTEPHAVSEQKGTIQKPSSYSYASSTSWDSWTNKTKRVEWDSVSGQTRKFEYDPISNRMVQVEAQGTGSKTIESGANSVKAPEKAATSDGAKTTTSTEPTTKDQPTKQTGLRKAIPIPPSLSQASHGIPLGFGKCTVTSIGPLKSTAVAPGITKSSALTKLPDQQKDPKKDLDLLTADDVRAAVGKTKETPSTAVKSSEEASQIDAILKERDVASSRMHVPKAIPTQWDQAEIGVMLDKELENLEKKKEKLLKDERGLFHIERQKRELQKLDDRIKQVTARVENLNLDAATKPTYAHGAHKPTGLQSSLDRMQSKDLPAAIEPDDSAAHECTEPLNAFNGVPKNWAQQAEMLQADRVRRTASKNPYPMRIPVKSVPDDARSRPSDYMIAEADEKAAAVRWMLKEQEAIDAAEASRAAAEALKAANADLEATAAAKAAVVAADAAKAAADAERKSKLEKANKLLEEEVAQQKMKMHEHETRYAHKIRALRQELEIAYKQSAVHSEKHLERITYLEQELAKAQKTSESRYVDKVKALRGELETAYKQSTVHSEKHLERVRYLEQELDKAQKASGDVLSKTTPVSKNQENEKIKQLQAAKAEQKARDDALVKEVKAIYENAYGPIDVAHRQPSGLKKEEQKPAVQVVEVESDVDLGEALARYEREAPPPYTPRQSNVEKEIAAKEKEFYEKQGPPSTTSAGVSEPAVNPVPSAIQWEEPPVYKVLAYDSGNDMMSTATTTSSFTDQEIPISIPQALSQLYQPARFVPYFAQLQKDGYQVIFGTKDLLLFKKVKFVQSAANAQALDGTDLKQSAARLEDHGLVGIEMEQEVCDPVTEAKTNTSINPIDGTAKSSTSVQSSTSASQTVNNNTTSPYDLYDDEDIEWRQYPRVRRIEPHFTGSRRRWNSASYTHSNSNSSSRRHSKRFEDRERHLRRKQKSRTFKWVLGVGLGTATVMYLVGAAAERAREREKEAARDEWARRAEEERRRWKGW